MALHSGVPEVTQLSAQGRDYYGQSVNRVARLLALAYGGQILLSRATAELVRDHLPQQVVLEDRGEHHLKDLSQPERVFQVVAPELPSNFPTLFRKSESEKTHQDPYAINPRYDWGEAPYLRVFYGRSKELETLSGWIEQEESKLIAVLGLGGAGKTTLSAHLADQLKERFHCIFWRSLRNAPTPTEFLADCLQFFFGQPELERPVLGNQLSRLFEYLRHWRCLLVLDNFETVLNLNKNAEAKKKGWSESYRPGYEVYGELLQRIGEERHQSCLLLTSREKPPRFATFEGRTLSLSGLGAEAGSQLLRRQGINGSEIELTRLVELYSGNPLALKLVCEPVRELFGGEAKAFLEHSKVLFEDVRTLLDQHFWHLAQLEKNLLYHLALAREPLTLNQLVATMQAESARLEVAETLKGLYRRSLIERIEGENGPEFGLQAVVLEYLSGQILDQVEEEINSGELALLYNQTLIKAQTKDYLRLSQQTLLLKPLLQRLNLIYGSPVKVEQRLLELLDSLRQKILEAQGYAGTNLFYLLNGLRQDLRGLDFSGLNLRQTYLQSVPLQKADFSGCDLSEALFTETFDGVMALAFSPDSRLMAMGSVNGQVRVWEVHNVRPIFSCRGHSKTVRSLFFGPNSATLATASDDGIVKLWEINTGRCLQIMYGHINRVWAVALSPDGRWLASGGEDLTIKLWDAITGECRYSLEGHINWVRSVAFSPDSLTLASGSGDKTVRLWEVASGQGLHTLQGHTDRVRSVAFSPDGQKLASGSEDRTIRLWNTADGAYLQTLSGHTDRVRSIAFGANRQILASGGDDQTVKLWDLTSAQTFKTLEGHGGWVWVVALNKDASVLATGGEYQTIKLWDTATGRCLRTLQGYSTWVGAVTFSPHSGPV